MRTNGRTEPDRAGSADETSAPSFDAAAAQAIIAAHLGMEGPLLPLLHALQDAFRCIPGPAIPMVADALNLSRAEVHGVVSFYHDFRRVPAARHVLKLCRAEACQSVGASPLSAAFLRRLGLAWGERTEDDALSVEPVFCLGLCACGPAALYDGEPVGRLTASVLDELAERARRA
ncbi:MAG: formate dehydrogenase subunit gamma [Acetobacteraceae bacterium]|nr:formate dehydrogenase subunit gamma [Acetobacteraceae bacterium]